MSAIFRAELANLQRLVEHQAAMQALDTNQRERIRTNMAANRAADRQAVEDVLAAADRSMTSTEISTLAGVSLRRTERILKDMIAAKTATRRRSATRRADGDGFRNNFRYRASK